MKYGIISDIHGNIEAFNACLAFLQNEVSAYICAGDIVGYGPNPNECVEEVRRLSRESEIIAISGNHDLVAAGLRDEKYFSDHAREAIAWTRKVLADENREFLRSLKTRFDAPRFTVVHGSPREPSDEYLADSRSMKENLSFFDSRVCFVGHSHIPFFYGKELVLLAGEERVKLAARSKSIANLGSIGQPRDRNPYASTGIFDDRKGEIRLKRIPYDVRKTQIAMAKAKLPEFLIERLAVGI